MMFMDISSAMSGKQSRRMTGEDKVVILRVDVKVVMNCEEKLTGINPWKKCTERDLLS